MTLQVIDNRPKRRDKLIIMMDILCISKKGTSKTHIMFKANLSFSQLNEYTNFLVQHHFLEPIGNGNKLIYKTTQRGLEFIERQQQIIGMFNDSPFEFKTNPPIKYPLTKLPLF